MAVLPILTVEKPADEALLRQKSKRVSRLDGGLQRLIDDLIDTVHANDGLGLAAPQVGRLLRICVVELPTDYDDPLAGQTLVLCNPEIVRLSEETWEPSEGCLSVPRYWAHILRAMRCTVKARDRQWKEFRVKGEGLLAQVLQHEIDHLNGVLFYDHLPSLDLLRPVEEKPPRQTRAASVAAVPGA
ncbi:MAG: peptide deformylase [Chloroflexi bacterium]|nr:peptide deformylase [Chloroflexota bacterium]